MELSTWSEQYYHPPTSTVMKLRLGATPYRCEFCRCNFASFRACKEKFSWRQRATAQVDPEPRPPAPAGGGSVLSLRDPLTQTKTFQVTLQTIPFTTCMLGLHMGRWRT